MAPKHKFKNCLCILLIILKWTEYIHARLLASITHAHTSYLYELLQKTISTDLKIDDVNTCVLLLTGISPIIELIFNRK